MINCFDLIGLENVKLDLGVHNNVLPEVFFVFDDVYVAGQTRRFTRFGRDTLLFRQVAAPGCLGLRVAVGHRVLRLDAR